MVFVIAPQREVATYILQPVDWLARPASVPCIGLTLDLIVPFIQLLRGSSLNPGVRESSSKVPLARSVNFYFTDESEPSLVITRGKHTIANLPYVRATHLISPTKWWIWHSAITVQGGTGARLPAPIRKCRRTTTHSVALPYFMWEGRPHGNAILKPPRNLQQKYCETSIIPDSTISGFYRQ